MLTGGSKNRAVLLMAQTEAATAIAFYTRELYTEFGFKVYMGSGFYQKRKISG